MTDEATLQQRHQVEQTLRQAFNSVAPKVMNVNDLVDNFERDDGRHFAWYEIAQKLVAEHKLESLRTRDVPGGPGVFTGPHNGQPSTFVSTDFVERMLLRGLESGRADAHLDVALKAGLSTVDAMRDSPDHTPEVQSGQIRPKPPTPRS